MFYNIRPLILAALREGSSTEASITFKSRGDNENEATILVRKVFFVTIELVLPKT